VREEWSCEPGLDKALQHRIALSLERSRPLLVGLAPSRAVPVVGDAGVRSDDDEALYKPRRLERQQQAAPAAERVSDVGRLPAGPAQGASRFVEPRAGAGDRRAAVTWEVGCDDLEVPSEVTCDSRPRGSSLREPVNQHDPRPLASGCRVQVGQAMAGRVGALGGHQR